jgi:hypothetical protein
MIPTQEAARWLAVCSRVETSAVDPDYHAIQVMQSNRVGDLQRVIVPCPPEGKTFQFKACADSAGYHGDAPPHALPPSCT